MLKGTATIELTDVKTGKKEVVKHDNLVTNAINDLLTLNPFGFRFFGYKNSLYNVTSTDNYHYVEAGKSFYTRLLPVCPNAVGGILLYEDVLEENPDKYYAPMENPLVGYSSNDVNTTTDERRGSMNQTESGPLEDGSGYRFVFDFSTSQANGTISSVGLTSANGGKAGYGSKEDTVRYPTLCVLAASKSKNTSFVEEFDEDEYLNNSILAMDPDTGIGYAALITAQNTIRIRKVKLPIHSVGLVRDFSRVEMLEDHFITTDYFASNVKTSMKPIGSSSNSPYCGACLVDGRDGYIWGFQHKDNSAGNSDGKAKVLWIKISKEDFSVTEGEWELDAQLAPFAYSKTLDTVSTKYGAHCCNNTIIKDGKLYALKHDGMGVYVIELNNITNIVLLQSDFVILPYATASLYPYSYSYLLNAANAVEIANVITYANAFISGGKIHETKNNVVFDCSIYTGTDYSIDYSGNNSRFSRNGGMLGSVGSIHCGPYKITPYFAVYAKGSTSMVNISGISVHLMTPYLATINNLPTPVEKTADKTMKITYILREEM